MQAVEARGGRCLTDRYLGGHALHRFSCAASHEWETAASNVLAGSWCVTCHRHSHRHSLEDAQSAAQARGGRCLSAQYVNSRSYLIWECDRGHTWRAPLATIRNHCCWCAQCAHLARISSRTSKARVRYTDAGKHLAEPD